MNDGAGQSVPRRLLDKAGMERTRKRSRWFILAAVILGTAIAGAALLAFLFNVRLVSALIIKDSTGAIIVRLPLQDGQFVHHYIHSIHKTPVDEYFEVHGFSLNLTKVKYDTYGVGMPSDAGEGFSIENGRFVVVLHRSFSSIPIRVSIVPDHGVIIGGTLFPFTRWVPQESAITLSAGRMLIFRNGRISPK
jgi:hypothetical protein